MRNSNFYLVALGLALSAGCKPRDFNTETSSTNQPQPSQRVDISGNVLGYIDYKGSIGRRAVRIYSKKVVGAADTYNTVIVEYPPILSVFPKFVSTPKSEEDIQDAKFIEKFANGVKAKINERIGDLKHILARVTVYRTVPRAGNASSFEMRRLRYDTTAKSLVTDNSNEVSVLTLAENDTAGSPLAGAKFSQSCLGPLGNSNTAKCTKVLRKALLSLGRPNFKSQYPAFLLRQEPDDRARKFIPNEHWIFRTAGSNLHVPIFPTYQQPEVDVLHLKIVICSESINSRIFPPVIQI